MWVNGIPAAVADFCRFVRKLAVLQWLPRQMILKP
jgi:hypothetical protein